MRRILTGSVIALLVCMAALTTAGIAAGGGMPEAFGTPAPHQGDAVLYNFTYGDETGGGFGASGGSQASTDFITGETERTEEVEVHFDGSGWGGLVVWSWEGPTEVRDAEGRTWAAATAQQAGLHHAIAPHRWAFDSVPLAGERVAMVGDEPIATERGLQEPLFTFNFAMQGPLGLNEDPQMDEDEHHVDWATGSLAPCFLRHGLQGHTVPTSQPVRLFAGCEDLGIEVPDALFRAVGVDRLDAGQALRFEGGGVTVWFSPDHPYPVQMDVPLDNVTVHITMEDFVRGDGPEMPPGALLDGSTATPVRMAPSLAWGMDDAGTDHPFPVSEAVTRALTDPSYPDFRDWVAAHPDWFAMRAMYHERTDGSDVEREWEVIATDGDDTFPLDVVRKDTAADRGLLRFVTDAPAVSTYEFGDGPAARQPVISTGIPERLPQHMPDSLPRLDSLVAYWQHFAGDVPFNAYGLELTCGADCSDVGYRVIAGHDSATDTPPSDDPGDPQGYFVESYRHDQSDLIIFADGAPAEHMVGESREVPAGASAPPTQIGGDGVATEELRSFWLMPEPETAAGVGLLAVLAGGLYWLWPALKTGLFAPLFSRIQGDAVLKHPLRQQIHDAVMAEPGIHFQELGRRIGSAHGAMHHHVRKLVEAGVLTAVAGDGYTCYFVKGQVDRRQMAAAPVLKAEPARRLAAVVQQQPGITSGEAAVRVGVSRSTMSYHIRRLEDAGLLRVERHGRQATLSLAA